MDLTQLTYYLGVVQSGAATSWNEIEEPIGFDGIKTTIKRGDYHGMSAEVSVGTLDFYGNAATIIRNAYNADIDTEVLFKVQYNNDVVYSGVIDLSTYSEKTGKCTKISCKVGEIGVKTTFNNRSQIEIDLNRATTLDGAALAHTPAWKRLLIPKKTIQYNDEMIANTEFVWDSSNTTRFHLGDDKSHQWINFPVSGQNRMEEFGEFGCSADIADQILADEPRVWNALISDYYEPIFSKGSDWNEKYGTNARYTIEYDIHVRVTAMDTLFTNSPAGGIQEMTTCLCLVNGNHNLGDPIDGSCIVKTEHKTMVNGYRQAEFRLTGTLTNRNDYNVYLGISMRNRNFYDDGIAIHKYYNDPAPMLVRVYRGSYIRFKLDSQGDTRSVNADTIMVHEALNKVVECISENQLTVKSDLYGRVDSLVNPLQIQYQPMTTSPFGNGSLKALTNGYKIRNLYSDEENGRNMTVSFKDMIEALDTIDCIGWGFVEENGQLYVRVENWLWFYKYNDLLLTITDPNEKTRSVDTDKIITSLNVGFKKYTTNEELNSIDSIHSERTFTSKMKAVTKELSKLCKWIADNYAIEETRRKALVGNSDEFKYDENIFVFELEADAQIGTYPNITYRVATNSVTNVSGINYGSELYNPRLSPRRMAERWKERLESFNTSSPFELTKGTVNYIASFKCKNSTVLSTICRRYYLDTPTSAAIAENESISNGTPYLKAETLKIKYPLTFAQYNTIKQNPYGRIVVDGNSYFIKEFQFSFKNGEAEFTLIPKTTN